MLKLGSSRFMHKALELAPIQAGVADLHLAGNGAAILLCAWFLRCTYNRACTVRVLRHSRRFGCGAPSSGFPNSASNSLFSLFSSSTMCKNFVFPL